jgi:NaMN:DMB phosphoribosyltransferase
VTDQPPAQVASSATGDSPSTPPLPAEAAAVLARITAAERSVADLPPDVTGALATLLGWWLAVAPDTVLRAVPVASGDRTEVSCEQSLVAGIRAAEAAIDAGATLLVPRATTRNARAARTVTALLARKDAATVVHQVPGMTDREWMAECVAVRDGAARLADRRARPLPMLEGLAATDVAFVTGVLLAAAARRTPCLVDGTDELAAALVADRMAYRATSWWLAASTSTDPARNAAIERMDLRTGLPLALADESGQGASACVTLLHSLTM